MIRLETSWLGSGYLVKHAAATHPQDVGHLMRLSGMLLAPFLIALGCQGGTNSAAEQPIGTSSETGLKGTVVLGPTRPVCRADDPCQAPFKARFEVRQGQRVVAEFTSDSAGRFVVYLPPGRYTVGPGPSTGILMRRQIHEVTVGSKGLTSVQWDFDTGISGVR
jgi:hypothetical protein